MYSCGFEQDTGIFRLEAKGPGFAAQLDPAIKTGRTIEAWGDYHDAADHDRLIGHVRIPAVLLTLYEMFPKAFTDGQLNIPESGNGIPDLVDEARWGVDFWVRMQDAGDGGVRGGAGPNAAVTAPPDRDNNPIYVYSKDPLSSLSLAAIAAQLSRVLGTMLHTVFLYGALLSADQQVQ